MQTFVGVLVALFLLVQLIPGVLAAEEETVMVIAVPVEAVMLI